MEKKGRLFWLGFCVLLFISFLAMAASAADDKEKKVTGTVVAAPADPAGKLAAVAMECNDGVYGITKNAVAEKMIKKWIGRKADVTGKVEEIDGKKVVTPYLIFEAGVKVKK